VDWTRCVARSDLAAALATAVCLVMTAGCNAAPTGPLGRTDSPGSAPVAQAVSATSAVRTVISANHGHTVVLTVDQLLSHAAMRLDIQGDADHSHTLDLSAEDVIDLDSGAGVIRTSSINAGHDHVVTFLGYWDY